jgi:hypothetical protein
MDFRITPIVSLKKADNRVNFTAGGIINRRTQYNSLRREDKNKHQVISYLMVYKAVSHVTLPRMRKPSLTPALVA